MALMSRREGPNNTKILYNHVLLVSNYQIMRIWYHFRQAHPRDLFLYVLSAVFSRRFRQMKNIVQERVHDHISYSGKIDFTFSPIHGEPT